MAKTTDKATRGLNFEGITTDDAAKVVAGELGLVIQIGPGVESTVTYNKDGTLGDFIREGLNPQYWYLTAEDDSGFYLWRMSMMMLSWELWIEIANQRKDVI